MKFIALVSVLTTMLLSDGNYELELYENLLPKLFKKTTLVVYTQEDEQRNILKKSTLLKISDDCSSSDLIMGKKLDHLPQECLNKPIFAMSYRSYMDSENAFGAFYWSKGRPQIQFKLKSVKKYNFYFPDDLQKYAK